MNIDIVNQVDVSHKNILKNLNTFILKLSNALSSTPKSSQEALSIINATMTSFDNLKTAIIQYSHLLKVAQKYELNSKTNFGYNPNSKPSELGLPINQNYNDLDYLENDPESIAYYNVLKNSTQTLEVKTQSQYLDIDYFNITIMGSVYPNRPFVNNHPVATLITNIHTDQHFIKNGYLEDPVGRATDAQMKENEIEMAFTQTPGHRYISYMIPQHIPSPTQVALGMGLERMWSINDTSDRYDLTVRIIEDLKTKIKTMS